MASPVRLKQKHLKAAMGQSQTISTASPQITSQVNETNTNPSPNNRRITSLNMKPQYISNRKDKIKDKDESSK